MFSCNGPSDACRCCIFVVSLTALHALWYCFCPDLDVYGCNAPLVVEPGWHAYRKGYMFYVEFEMSMSISLSLLVRLSPTLKNV